jgi:putative transposase
MESPSIMSKPSRPSDPSKATGEPRTFFVTTKTSGARSLLQTDRMASLLIDVLRSYVRANKFTIHDFVIMPNHVHILLTIPGSMTLEKAMQLIKGNFSLRAGRELGFRNEIWQRGFSDVRVTDEQSFRQHREYIENNPVKAGLVASPEEFPFGSAYLKERKRAGAKALDATKAASGTTEVVP